MQRYSEGNMLLSIFPLKSWSKEPLVHFLMAGALVFAYFQYFAPPDPEESTIVFSREMLADIRASWNERWRRPPSNEEFEGLLANAIKEEVFYQEALRLGLDQDDAVVRNRMIQKMRFINSSRVDSPSEKQLQAWFAEHSNQYQTPTTMHFQQVYLGRDLSAQQVAELIAKLEGQEKEQAMSVLEPFRQPLSVPSTFEEFSDDDIARQFGQRFADDLQKAQLNTWIGPVFSGFGQHLVFVTANQESTSASLADPRVRQRVENDWLAAQTADAETQALEQMLQHYKVVIAE